MTTQLPTLSKSIVNPHEKETTESTTWSIKKVSGMYVAPTETGYNYATTRLRVPECQRPWGWDGKRGLVRQQNLIHSILHGYPVPPPVLNYSHDEDGNEHWDIYDGRHRIETIQRFHTNKLAIPTIVDGNEQMVKFSQLHFEDQITFEKAHVPMIIANNASRSILSTIFSRMNDFVSLKDKDHIWAARDEPLVDATLKLLLELKGKIELVMSLKYTLSSPKLREHLPDWVGVAAGANQYNATTMTSSYICLSPYLQTPFHPDGRVSKFFRILLNMYERAEKTMPMGHKLNKRGLAKINKYTIHFADNLFRARDASMAKGKSLATADEETIKRWVKVLTYEWTRGDRPSLFDLLGSGRANTSSRIAQIRERIERWEAADGEILPYYDAEEGATDDEE
jgi:hypothetical protein